jgi:hypothetical protein
VRGPTPRTSSLVPRLPVTIVRPETVNRPAVFREQLPVVFSTSVSVPELGLQDQAARSGRAASVLDEGRVLAGNHQRLIGASRGVGEGIRG